MKLALFQNENAGSIEENLNKSVNAIKEASENGADLVLFSEVHLSEFFPQYEKRDANKYACTIDSPMVKAFCEACKKYHIMAVPNIYLKEDNEFYDTSLFIDKNGEMIGMQKMVHIAQAPKFYEQDYYTPSNEGFKVFETTFGKIGIVVCFDRHYPESIRSEALMGADLILIPTVNTKEEPLEMFEKELQVQAFWNSVYIAMCNRVGMEDKMHFAGESIVIDPSGNTLLKAKDQEEILYIEIDLKEVKKIREAKNYTNLRRVEFYK